MTVETATPYRTLIPVRYPADDGWLTPRPPRNTPVFVAVGAFKMAALGSAAALTLAAGGLALSDVASIMASFGGVLVSIVTLSLMARKWLKERHARTLHLAPPMPPIAPPGLPTTRVNREDYATAVRAWEHYGDLVEQYHIELAAFHAQQDDK